MKYPRILPARTIIRIMKRPGITQDAFGMEIQLREAVQISEKGEGYSGQVDITKHPPHQRWHMDTVNHDIDLNYDVIVSGVENRYLTHSLETLED